MRALALSMTVLVTGAFATSALANDLPTPVEGYEDVYRAGDTLLASQPSEEDLTRLIEDLGIRRVVNLAHPRFMERMVSFDEGALLADAGVEYIHVAYPEEGDDRQARVRVIHDAVADSEGTVLLHSGWIGDVAAHWAAAQVVVAGLDPLKGYEVFRYLGGDTLRIPFEGYAGGRLVATGVWDGAHPDVAAQEVGSLDSALSTAPVALPINVPDPEGIRGGLLVDGRFAVAGQPDEETLERMASEGYSLVFNLRRLEEMEHVDFDEARVCEWFGMRYVHVPTGWSNEEYTPEQLSAFASAIEKQPGRVLVHCQVGWRAQHFWGAYLHRYRGLSVTDALWVSHSPDESWPFTAYERLIGQTLQYELQED